MSLRLRWVPSGRATCTSYDDQAPIVDVTEIGSRRRLITIMPDSPHRITADEMLAVTSLIDALIAFVGAAAPWVDGDDAVTWALATTRSES